jgi:holo-[acyl-carrier protein] synthase
VVVGLGIDMIEIARVEKSIARFGNRFLGRVFTAAERKYCESKAKNSAQSFALRWAAKEAVAKALGTGIRGGVDFKDIEVVTDKLGRPSARLAGGAAKRARAAGIDQVHLSLSHDGPHAVALAVAEGNPKPKPTPKPKPKGKRR